MTERILVVEDGEDNRRIMNDLLVAAGYVVVHAATGDEGLALAKAERPDLILMDIKLPGMDGLEVTRRIKADAALQATPIFAVTSYAMSDDNARALAAGCDAYFSKPVSPRKLLAKIRETLA
jgi:two-component system cell cycle response regulator DivK